MTNRAQHLEELLDISHSINYTDDLYNMQDSISL